MADFVMPTQQVLVSFADPFTTPDWIDISQLNEGWSGKIRGREHELQRFAAGQVALTLNNQDGRFSRWNTNSPYWNLLSGQDADCQNLSTQPNPQAFGPLVSGAATGKVVSAFSLPQNCGGFLIMLGVVIASGTVSVSTVSGPTGLAGWGKLAGIFDATDSQRVEIWYTYVSTNAAVSGNIALTYSGSVVGVNCELSTQVFTGYGSFTSWVNTAGASQFSSATTSVGFPSLTTTAPSIYFGLAWSQSAATTSLALGQLVNGIAPSLTANSNLVIYNPDLLSGASESPSFLQTFPDDAQAAAVTLSPNGFTWGHTTNCTALATLLPSALWTGNPTNGNGNSGPYGLKLTSAGAGNMLASTATGLNAYPVSPSTPYTGMVSMAPASTTRNFVLFVLWYDSSGTLISAPTNTVAESASVWVKNTLTLTSPSNAAYAAIGVQVTATAGANEVHYVQRAGLFNATSAVTTGWAPGQRAMVPARSIWIKPTWSSTTYNTYRGFVDSWVPIYKGPRSQMTVQCSDALGLLALANMDSSLYANQVVLDGALGFWRCGDSGTPPSLMDSSGNNHWAPVTGTVTGGQTGPIVTDPANGAISFLTGYATTPSGSAGPTGTAWTVEAWFQMPGPSTTGGIYDQGSSSGHSGMRLAIGSGKPFLSVFNSGGTDLLNFAFTTARNDDIWHHLVLTVNGTAWSAYLDYNAEQHSGTLSSSVSVSDTVATISMSGLSTFNGNLADVAVYTGALTAAQVQTHYQLGAAGSFSGTSGAAIENVLLNSGWPSSLMSNIATGRATITAPSASSLSTTNLLTYIQTVEAAEQGAFYADGAGNFIFRDRWYTATASLSTTSQATLASDNNNAHFHFNDGTIVPASDAQDIYNDMVAQTSANGSQPFTFQDAASIAWYGRRSLSGYDSLPFAADISAAGEGNVLINAYGQPVPRIRTISLDNLSNAGANLPIMLGLDILARISVIWQPIDGSNSPLQQDYFIESITHAVVQGHWTTTWGLSIPYTWLTWNQ